MNPAEIHEWILKVAAPVVALVLLLVHAFGPRAFQADPQFYLLVGALLAARWVLPGQDEKEGK